MKRSVSGSVALVGLLMLTVAATVGDAEASRRRAEKPQYPVPPTLPPRPPHAAAVERTPNQRSIMSRFPAWLAIGIASAFLVVVSASFSASSTAWLTFGISIGTLVVSAALAYTCRNHVATLVTALITTVVSGWTIVASLVFSHSTVQDLALASSLALSGLAIVGLTVHDLSVEFAAHSMGTSSDERKSRLAAAA